LQDLARGAEGQSAQVGIPVGRDKAVCGDKRTDCELSLAPLNCDVTQEKLARK